MPEEIQEKFWQNCPVWDWAPKLDLDEGLKRAIDWYQEYFSHVSIA